MPVTDLVLLPAGCLLCGLLAGSPPVVRLVPLLRALLESLERVRAQVGMATAIAALIALAAPVHGPPVLGSLFPAAAGFTVGLLLCLDVLLDLPLIKRNRRAFALFGSALVTLKRPLGFLAALLGLLHFLAPQAPFF